MQDTEVKGCFVKINTQEKHNLHIGVILVTLMDTYQQSILSGIQKAGINNNIKILCIQDTEPDSQILNKKRSIYPRIKSLNLDAVILFTAVIETLLGKEDFKRYISFLGDLPIISIGVNLPGKISIMMDNESGINTLMTHIIEEHKCREIAFLAGPKKNNEANARFTGYKKALERYNIDYDPELVVFGDFAPGDGTRGIINLLDKRKKSFKGIICIDDYNALEAIKELKRRGKRIPEDYIITGFDDIENSEYYSPGLTTVKQPLFDIGYRSVVIILEKHTGKPVNKKILMNLPMIQRESCGCKSILFYNYGTIQGNIKKEQNNKLLKDKIKSLLDVQPILTDPYMPDKEKLKNDVKQLSIVLQNYIDDNIEENLWLSINTLITDSYHAGKSGMFWIRLLNPVFQKMEKEAALSIIWNKLSYYILLAEDHFKGLKKLHYDHMNLQFTGLLDLLIAGSSREKLRMQLNKCLPIIGIKNMQIIVYDKEGKKASVLYSYCKSNIHQYEDMKVKHKDLFHGNCLETDENSNYIYPIYSEYVSVGYLIMDMGDFTFEFYNDIFEKISKGIDGILLMDQINIYTTHLEETIAKRTAQLEKANQKLRELSYIDHLSGLKNRRFLNEVIIPESKRLSETMAYVSKNKDNRQDMKTKVVAVFLLDIDHFKDVNDTYGHEAGDTIICQFSTILKDQCRENDFVVRLGGEEFLIVMKNFDPDWILKKAESIRKAIEFHNFIIPGNITIKKTASIGSICFPNYMDNPEALDLNDNIELVDQALYCAKQHGRNLVVFLKINNEIFCDKNYKNKLLYEMDECRKKGLASFTSISGIIE